MLYKSYRKADPPFGNLKQIFLRKIFEYLKLQVEDDIVSFHLIFFNNFLFSPINMKQLNREITIICMVVNTFLMFTAGRTVLNDCISVMIRRKWRVK